MAFVAAVFLEELIQLILQCKGATGEQSGVGGIRFCGPAALSYLVTHHQSTATDMQEWVGAEITASANYFSCVELCFTLNLYLVKSEGIKGQQEQTQPSARQCW